MCPDILDLMNHIQTLYSTSEDGVLVIQPWLCLRVSKKIHT